MSEFGNQVATIWRRIRFEKPIIVVLIISIAPPPAYGEPRGSSPSIKPLTVYRGHGHAILSVAFSADHRYVASTGLDKSIHVWQLDGSPLAQLGDWTPNGRSVAFSPDGIHLSATTGAFGASSKPSGITIWKLATREPRYQLPVAEIQHGTCVAYSPNGEYVASGAELPSGAWTIVGADARRRYRGSIELWDASDLRRFSYAAAAEGRRRQPLARDFRKRGALSEYLKDVSSVAFSPDSKVLATGGTREICLWRIPGGERIRRIKTGSAIVGHIGYHPNGQLLLSVGSRPWRGGPSRHPSDRDVYVWNLNDGTLYAQLKGHVADVRAAAFSPNGKVLASASSDATIRLWDVASKKLIGTLHGHTLPVVCVAFSSDGATLASGSWDRTVRLWDLADALARAKR